MTRQEYIDEFKRKYGDTLAMNVRGKNVFLVPVDYMAKFGMKETFTACGRKCFKEVTGTPEAVQAIPDKEVVNLIAVISGAPAVEAKVHKLPDDPLGIIRLSIGGSTTEGIYVMYRGNIQDALKTAEVALHLLREQAKRGEANPTQN